MKKLYRKGTVHPSPPSISDHLAFLPATILTLTVALSPEDREILAYLLSCSNPSVTGHSNFSTSQRATQKSGKLSGQFSAGKNGFSGFADHPPVFRCNCFRCYTNYWVRWDSSPNRQLIHEIIDGFEDWLVQSKGAAKNKKDKKKKGKSGKSSTTPSSELNRTELSQLKTGLGLSDSVEETSAASGGSMNEDVGDDGDVCFEKGSMRRLVSFIGERIWGVWGQGK